MRTTNLIRAPPEPRPTPSRSREMRAATSDFNLGPLTTTFKPPPSCSFPVVNQAVDPPFVAWLLQSCYTSTHATNDLACRPTPVASAHPGIEWGYYSPGLICPSGWVHACSATASTSSDFKFQFTPKGEETAVGCCPSGYFCSYYAGNEGCASLASSTSFQGVFCKNSQSILTEVTLPATTLYTMGFKTTVETITVWAQLIQLMQQPSDLSAIRSIPSSTNASSSSLSEIDHINPLPSGSPTTNSGGEGISGGAIAGIVIGSLVGLALLLLAVVFSFRNRKQRKRLASDWEKPELPGEGAIAGTSFHVEELDAMPPKREPQELDAIDTQPQQQELA